MKYKYFIYTSSITREVSRYIWSRYVISIALIFLLSIFVLSAQDTKIAKSVFGCGSAVMVGNEQKATGTLSQSFIGTSQNNSNICLAGFWYNGPVFVGVEENETTSLNFLQYPNPFSNSVNIFYTLPNEGFVSISIYNIAGKEIFKLVNNEMESPGNYTKTWNGTDSEGNALSNGVYYVKYEFKSPAGRIFSDMKSITLVR